MPNIQISVANKIATNMTPGTLIVCGNSDYTASFTFDSEWTNIAPRTARFLFYKQGRPWFQDVTFTGASVQIPVMSGVEFVLVGAYAGDLHTTTPARILCSRSILCDEAAELPAGPTKESLERLIAEVEQKLASGAFNGPPGPAGGGVTILGSYSSASALNSAHPTGNAGDAYLVNGSLYVWSATTNKWENVGNIQGPQGNAGRGIVSITRTYGTGAAGTVDTYTIKYTDNTTSTFQVRNGADGTGAGGTGENGATFTPYVDTNGNLSWTNDKGLTNPATVNVKGPQGNAGRGIASITRTSGTGAAGTVDTYTIKYTDNTTSTFQVRNGADGTGTGGTGENGATFTPYVDSNGNLSWTNDKGLTNPTTVNIKGPQGNAGNPGRGIASITRTAGTGAAGTVDTYTIKYTDNTTSTFQVRNGANGTSGSGTGGTGENGATFTPYVDSNGNLSWTNDKGLTNPTTVNVKGPKGDRGDNGTTPQRGTHYWTAADIAEIKSYVDSAILGGAW